MRFNFALLSSQGRHTGSFMKSRVNILKQEAVQYGPSELLL